jgi:hypothetical protein
MKLTTQNEHQKTNISVANEVGETPRRSKKPSNLSKDEGFLLLHEYYQCADYNKCVEIIDRLEASYPDHPTLQKFKEEITIRQTVRSVAKSQKNNKKHKKFSIRLRLAAFAFLSTLVVLVAFLFSYFHFSTQVSARQIDDEASQLAELSEQVEHLILVGKPRPAAERIAKIRAINSEYGRLSELEAKVYDLLLLETKYQSAVDLQEDGNHLEVLAFFREIESDWPGLWDVQQQIKTLEDRNYH